MTEPPPAATPEQIKFAADADRIVDGLPWIVGRTPAQHRRSRGRAAALTSQITQLLASGWTVQEIALTLDSASMEGIGNAEGQEARWRKALKASRVRHRVVEARIADPGHQAAGVARSITISDGLAGDDGARQHRPFLGERFAGGPESVARCQDCCWAQVVDEDLHEDNVAGLFAWHAARPADAVDHLQLFNVPLAIPEYIYWEDNNGVLALRDNRTGGYHLRFNHECLAIFNSVATYGALDGAIVSEAQRLGIARRLAMNDIIFVASDLYRRGLLRPALESKATSPSTSA